MSLFRGWPLHHFTETRMPLQSYNHFTPVENVPEKFFGAPEKIPIALNRILEQVLLVTGARRVQASPTTLHGRKSRAAIRISHLMENITGRSHDYTRIGRGIYPRSVLSFVGTLSPRLDRSVGECVNPGRSRRERRDVVRVPAKPGGLSLPKNGKTRRLLATYVSLDPAHRRPTGQSGGGVVRPRARALVAVKLIPI